MDLKENTEVNNERVQVSVAYTCSKIDISIRNANEQLILMLSSS